MYTDQVTTRNELPKEKLVDGNTSYCEYSDIFDVGMRLSTGRMNSERWVAIEHTKQKPKKDNKQNQNLTVADEEISGVYTVRDPLLPQDVMKLNCEVSFERCSRGTHQQILADMLKESVQEIGKLASINRTYGLSHEEKDKFEQHINRANCLQLQRLDDLEQIAKFLVNLDLREYEYNNKSCTGIAGFVYHNLEKPGPKAGLRALAGRVKDLERLVKKCEEKTQIDYVTAQKFLARQKPTYRYNPSTNSMIFDCMDIVALRGVFYDADTRDEYLYKLLNNSQVLITDVDLVRKSTGYSGTHVLLQIEGLPSEKLGLNLIEPSIEIEMQLLTTAEADYAGKDDYHERVSRKIQLPECREYGIYYAA